MAETVTARLNLHRWGAGTDTVQRAEMVEGIIDELETRTVIFVTGARPAAGVAGRFHYASDTGLTYDTGAAWVEAGGADWQSQFLLMGA